MNNGLAGILRSSATALLLALAATAVPCSAQDGAAAFPADSFAPAETASFSSPEAASPSGAEASAASGTPSADPRSMDCPSAFSAGVAAYAAGKWDAARLAWERCLDLGVRDERVHYDLGNAWFRLGEVGWAILHYEKALAIDPGFADARANLDLAKSRRADLQPARADDPLFARLLAVHSFFSIPFGMKLLLALAFLFGGALSVALLGRGRFRAVAGTAAAAVAVLALPVLLSVGYKVWENEFAPRGVVLDRTADLRSGPAAREQVIATVHAGAEVDVKGRSGDWIQVRAGENLEGWLPATAVGVVQDGF